jgi:uncharacterized protein GlcG (DUF336 family)
MTDEHWTVAVAIAVAALASLPAAGEAIRTERSIALDAALEAATAAQARCRKDGFQTTVTVLDRAGRTRVVLHDDGASPHTIEHSLRKAYTALTYRTPSGEYGKRATANPQSVGPLHLANITTAEGGLPIRAGSDLVGAIGVSGSPGGDKDAACAQAGIDQIAKSLGNP